MAGRILPDHEYSLKRELFRQLRRGQYGILHGPLPGFERRLADSRVHVTVQRFALNSQAVNLVPWFYYSDNIKRYPIRRVLLL